MYSMACIHIADPHGFGTTSTAAFRTPLRHRTNFIERMP